VLFFRLIDHPRVRWQDDVAYSVFNLYRGDLAELLAGGSYTQQPGSNDYAARFCDLADVFMDYSLLPGVGEAFYWPVSGEGTAGETPLGDWADVGRPNDHPCP
jgi:hypothetical protein